MTQHKQNLACSGSTKLLLLQAWEYLFMGCLADWAHHV